MSVRFDCRQCGATGLMHPTDDTPWPRLTLDIENAHAAQHPECPYDRARFTLTLVDDAR
jgi:hypothetical protein